MPEFDCDINKKKGEKVDYAIMKGGSPVILIECKHCTQNLELHNTQLRGYFAASKARFGVLTNGIEYRFYADLDKTNIMDEKPFMVLDMLNLSDHDIDQLKKFHKSYFNESKILSTAQQLQISLAIRQVINRNFENPSAKFTQYFVKETNNGYYTAKQIEQYVPLVKKEIGSYIDDVISERLNKAKEQQTVEQTGGKPEPADKPKDTTESNNGIVTTREELDAYNIVRSILRKEVDVSRITYKDCKTYFIINLDNTNRKWEWIYRFYFNAYKYISFPSENGKGEDKIWIKSLDEIFNHSDRLVESLKSILK
jgi:hypothetical protein